MVLVQSTVLQRALTIAMHTNMCELGWCKCGICVGQKINSGLGKLRPEFEADLSQQGFSTCWPSNGCSSIPSSNTFSLGSKQHLWRLWASTSITTVNSHKRNLWRRDWRRGVGRNRTVLGLDNTFCVSVCNLWWVKAIVSEILQLADYWVSREL